MPYQLSGCGAEIVSNRLLAHRDESLRETRFNSTSAELLTAEKANNSPTNPRRRKECSGAHRGKS